MNRTLQPKAILSLLVLLLATLLFSSCKPRPCAGPLTLTVSTVLSEKLSHLTPGQELKRGDAAADPAGVLISVDTPCTKLDEFCRRFADGAGLKLNSRTPLIGRVTVHLENVTILAALESVLDSMALAMVVEDGVIFIMSPEEYEALPPVQRVYTITHTNKVLAMRFALEALGKIDSAKTEPAADGLSVAVTAHRKDHLRAEQAIQAVNTCRQFPVFPKTRLPETIPANLPAVTLRGIEQPNDDGLTVHFFFFENIDARPVLDI
ncbi:MAG: hypothetical protein U1F77_12110, partial [Kiritimatiellia bacterium]